MSTSGNGQDEDVTLSVLLRQSIETATTILDTSNYDAPQLTRVLSHFSLCASLIQRLAIISTNETLDDLSTSTLYCLLVPYFQAALTLQVRSSGSVERMALLNQAKTFYDSFLSQLRTHEILRDQPALPNIPNDPASRRASKIAAYKREKELQASITHLSSRRGTVSVNTVEVDDDDTLRSLLLTQIALYHLRALNDLSSISTELELLQLSIPMSDLPTHTIKEDEDSTWRLDRPTTNWFDPTSGPVLSNEGKVMRPFTILPSKMQTRLALQQGVFREGRNLPTMSIDEFLDQEMAMGNVLQGGEADAQRQDDESRTKKEAVELDTNEAYEEGERRLREARDWDDYRDEHKRGEGNMIGRG